MTTPAKKLLLLCLFSAAYFLVGCQQPEPPGKLESELSPSELHGKKLFVTRCAACHEAHSTKPFHGPGLAGVMQHKYLPSGVPANDDRVREVLEHGRKDMPAFGNLLDDGQINDLIAYLHTL